jgi:type I restriction enzyme S subunit
MTVNNKNSSVPKLRFKEFKGDWQVKKLGDVCEKESSSISANSIANNNGEYKIYGASGLLKNIDFYTQEKSYIAIIKDGSGVGRTLLCSKKSSVIGTLDILKNKNKNVLKFILETIDKISFNKYIVGGAIPHIYFKDYSKNNIFVPNPKEQQKIADCLTSLDDLITTQDRKLQNLKTHKKGLMQKLFPATNQTTPQLRFTEFSGDWQVKKLGDIGKASMCKRILKSQTNTNKGIPFYKIGTFGKKEDAYISVELYENYKNKYSFPKKGDILISASGTIGRLVIYNDKPAYFQDSNIVWIANNENMVKNNFLFFIYQKTKWNTENSTIARLYNESLRSVLINTPKPKEQQKIADCLTSLDDLITAQSSKITTLKTHKKGLMQQLFPDNNRKMI